MFYLRRKAMKTALKVLLGAAVLGTALSLRCGVATNTFPACPSCLGQGLDGNLIDFWWNWDTHPKVDETQLTPR